ncbi:MAG: Rhs element Vgr protein, partial [Acidobacteria bacterium]|nr:Rhs element Vgr protein [Acidobacteriota bacterium]
AVLDDQAAGLTLEDQNGNRIVLGKEGITLTSAKDLKLSAKGAVTVDAGTSLALTAKSGATLDGSQVTVKARSKLSATASGTAELKSTGILTVKGSLVKIN